MAYDLSTVADRDVDEFLACVPATSVQLWFRWNCPDHGPEIHDQYMFEDVTEMIDFLRLMGDRIDPIMAYCRDRGAVVGARELYDARLPEKPYPTYDYPRPTPEDEETP